MEIKRLEEEMPFWFVLIGHGPAASPLCDKSSTNLELVDPQETANRYIESLGAHSAVWSRQEGRACWPCVLDMCSSVLHLVPLFLWGSLRWVLICLWENSTEALRLFCDVSQTSIILKTKSLPLFIQRKVIIFFPLEFRNLTQYKGARKIYLLWNFSYLRLEFC